MKTKLLALIFLAGSSMFAQRISVGIGIGGGYGGYPVYAPAPVYVYSPPPAPYYYAPPMARPGYTWISGYWYPRGSRWAWRNGYYARPPYARARWVGPRWNGRHYYGGYWRR